MRKCVLGPATQHIVQRVSRLVVSWFDRGAKGEILEVLTQENTIGMWRRTIVGGFLKGRRRFSASLRFDSFDSPRVAAMAAERLGCASTMVTPGTSHAKSMTAFIVTLAHPAFGPRALSKLCAALGAGLAAACIRRFGNVYLVRSGCKLRRLSRIFECREGAAGKPREGGARRRGKLAARCALGEADST
jgi:hypothetical protein